MKTDPRGQPTEHARNSAAADGTATPMKPAPRRALISAAIVLAALLVLVVARHPIVGFIASRGIAALTGDRVAFRSFTLGSEQSVVNGLSVRTSTGEPLVAAERVQVRYSLHDLLWGGRHRYGIESIAIDRPTLTIVRHADGTYNLGGRGSGGGSSMATARTPLAFDVRVRGGTLELVDRAPVAPDLRQQELRAITVDARVASDRQSRAWGQAIFVGRRTAGALPVEWPIRLSALSDTPRGLAIVQARAAALPLRGAIGFVQHSAALRVDDGVLQRLQFKLFALNIGLDRPVDLHFGGHGDLIGGRLNLSGLRLPVRDLHGRLWVTDDGVWSRGLTGSVAGVPLNARGGAYNRQQPVVRLGLAATGDLRALRALFAFSRRQPIAGVAHLETLVEAPASNILVRTVVQARGARYGEVPLTDFSGRVDYHRSTVVLAGLRARYGAADLRAGGRFLLGGSTLDSRVVVAAAGPGRMLPYAENVAPEGKVDILALIAGGTGYRARGAIGVHGAGVTGDAMFAINEYGVGEFGPFTFERRDGTSLAGALRLERPTSRSAAWIVARGYRIEHPILPSRLLGLSTPAFPPIAGLIDASLVGGGSPDAFGLLGDIRARQLRIGNAVLGQGSARLGGTLRDVRLSDVTIDGPLGRFRGAAAATGEGATLAGQYDGSLDRLVPLTGKQAAHGELHGPVLASLSENSVVVQSTGAALRNGSIRGVALDRAAGTLAVRANVFHLVVANGSIGNKHAIARETDGRVAVSAADLPARSLRGTGLPLDAGNLSVYGSADLRGKVPGFAGTVAVADGRARGYRIAGDAQIDLAGSRARIIAATGALGSTYGAIGGAIDGIGGPALRYDLNIGVPLGDINLLGGDLGLPVRFLEGSFAAQLQVKGAGTRPSVAGFVTAPEGRYNGLAFSDAAARLTLDAGGVAARDGRLTVGSTRAALAASTGGGEFAVAASAPHADLADFNDYFDASDTLAGHGSVDLAFSTAGGRPNTRGRLDLAGLRFRDFAIGAFQADWHMESTSIAGRANIGGPAGSLAATGRITPARDANLLAAFRSANYDVRATFGQIDLGTWLPAAGFTQPVLGKVDARATATGRWPRLALGVDATLDAGSVAGYPVRDGHLRAAAVGSRINVLASSADLGFAKLAGSGRLGALGADPVAFDLQATTDDIGPAVRMFVPAARGRTIAGHLNTDIRVSGTMAKPTLQGGFDLTDARDGTFAIPSAVGALALAGRSIELRDADVEFASGQAFVAGSLPLQLQPFRLGPPRAPISFDVTARAVDLAQFSPLLPAGTKLGGRLDGRFGVEGTVDRPRLLGSLSITDGSYLSTLERAPIAHFNARLRFAGSSVGLEAFHAGVGNGTLDAGGRIELPFGGDSATNYALDVRAKAAQLDFPTYGRGTIDGRLKLTGGSGQPQLGGTVALRDAVIPVGAIYGSAAAAGGAPSAGGLPIDPSFNLRATVGNNVRVRSSIVDIGVTGTVDVTGSLSAPKLAGAFTATDGTVSSYNHTFRVVNAAATFDPADGILPTINARASARVSNPDPDPSRNIAGSANIIVTVSGTPDSNNLAVSYSSDPPYSQEQIVGLLLDVPALLGAVNFNLNGGSGATLLRGAPGETNVLLPPGTTPEQVSAISFNQEVFSLLNGQFTQRALSPVERVFEKIFGLSDLEFTVDYGGGIGYSLRRQIGKRDFYAFLSQTVSYPERTNLGFELEPKPFETLNFSYYEQNGVTSLITNQTPGAPFSLGSTRRLTGLQPLGNRSGFSLDFSRRF